MTLVERSNLGKGLRPTLIRSVFAVQCSNVVNVQLTDEDHEAGVYSVGHMRGCTALYPAVGPQVALLDLVIVFARERLKHLCAGRRDTNNVLLMLR